MASKKERWLSHLYLSLHIKNHPKEGLPLTIGLETLEQQNIIGTADATQSDERWIIQLAAMDRKTHLGFASLLFLGIDKDRAEAIYGDITTLNCERLRKIQTREAQYRHT